MQTGKAQILQLLLEDGCHHVRVACPPGLVPSAGQYVLAGADPLAPLPVPLFHTDAAPDGFIAAGPLPGSWTPGMALTLRGPLGHGFILPLSARRVGLVAFDGAPDRLKGLIRLALKQEAAVVLVCGSTPDSLPDEVEVQPLSTLQEIAGWADYLAFDVERENLNRLREQLGKLNSSAVEKGAQALVRTPIPCGGVGDCGVCAVNLRSSWRLVCKEGPVFDWKEVWG